MAAIVPPEQGQTTIPSFRAEPLAIGAMKSR
jgi:hypothetical protein